MAKVPKLIGPGQYQRKSEQGVMVLGVGLTDAREEIFVRLVCDGIAIGIAFVRAGFTSKSGGTPAKIWALPHIQERARAILDARATTGVVTLPEVTDMLKRVFTGAYNGEEYSAAHNAAFSLARLYGHVTDRSTLEVVRRPSRDPDAPSEQALGDWVAGLPALNGPGPAALGVPSNLPLSGPPAAPLGLASQGPAQSLNDINGLGATAGPEPSGPEPVNWEKLNDFKGLDHIACDVITPEPFGPDGIGPGRPENGAPARPVTVTPTPRAGSDLLGTTPPGGSEKGAPVEQRQVPVLTGEFPKFEDLF